MPGYLYTGEDERTYEDRSLVCAPGSPEVVDWPDGAPDYRWTEANPEAVAAAEAASKAAAAAAAEFGGEAPADDPEV